MKKIVNEVLYNHWEKQVIELLASKQPKEITDSFTPTLISKELDMNLITLSKYLDLMEARGIIKFSKIGGTKFISLLQNEN